VFYLKTGEKWLKEGRKIGSRANVQNLAVFYSKKRPGRCKKG